MSVKARDSRVQRRLNSAVKKGCVEKVSQLLSQGANVNRMYHGQTPLHVASRGTGPNELRHQLPKYLEVVKMLVEAGANVNRVDKERNMTPLIYACESGETAIGSYLLKMGADVNASDTEGMTPLLYALHNGLNVSFISDLLKAGASAECGDCEEGGPLHAVFSPAVLYSENDRWDVLELLLSYPCDIDAGDGVDGTTPLHMAVDFYDLKSARILVQAGCKVNVENDEEDSPMSEAIRLKLYHLVELFLAAGERIPRRKWMVMQSRLERKDPSILNRLLAVGAECPKLSNMCRRTFYDHYGTQVRNQIKNLVLSPLIKRYLSYEIL